MLNGDAKCPVSKQELTQPHWAIFLHCCMLNIQNMLPHFQTFHTQIILLSATVIKPSKHAEPCADIL